MTVASTILIWLIAVPVLGGVLAWIASRTSEALARWISLLALAVNLLLVALLWAAQAPAQAGPWLAEINLPWIPQLGISFLLAIDGLSLVLVALANFLGIMAVAASWREIRERVGLFHLNLLWVLAAIIGVFLALDLFLFSFFWEAMLIPSYLLFVWGKERRFYAAVKFFIFTQLSGLLMLLSILGLYFVHGQSTGTYTFNYNDLLRTPLDPTTATWLMLGFFIAFAVKLPVVPFHSWLPPAYVESPTGVTVVLAGVMAKAAGYGLLRFAIPLFPGAATAFAPVAFVLAVVGILYSAFVAYSQTDLKRMIAYSSVSHTSFILMGVFAWNELALQGVVMQMVAHGISIGGLFILAGMLEERLGTRDLYHMGGLWATIPRMSGIIMVFAMATLGLPGLANFIGEFLILIGTYPASGWAAALGAVGIVLATVYALWMVQLAVHGPNDRNWQLRDVLPREAVALGALIVVMVGLGLYPRPVLDASRQAIANLQQSTAGRQMSADGAGAAQPPAEKTLFNLVGPGG